MTRWSYFSLNYY